MGAGGHEIAYSEARKAKAIIRACRDEFIDNLTGERTARLPQKSQDLVDGLSITKVVSRFVRDHCLGAQQFTAVPILSLKKVDNGKYLG